MKVENYPLLGAISHPIRQIQGHWREELVGRLVGWLVAWLVGWSEPLISGGFAVPVACLVAAVGGWCQGKRRDSVGEGVRGT